MIKEGHLLYTYTIARAPEGEYSFYDTGNSGLTERPVVSIKRTSEEHGGGSVYNGWKI